MKNQFKSLSITTLLLIFPIRSMSIDIDHDHESHFKNKRVKTDFVQNNSFVTSTFTQKLQAADIFKNLLHSLHNQESMLCQESPQYWQNLITKAHIYFIANNISYTHEYLLTLLNEITIELEIAKKRELAKQKLIPLETAEEQIIKLLEYLALSNA